MSETMMLASKLLQQIADQLKNLSAEEVRLLEEGECKVTLCIEEKPQRRAKQSQEANEPDFLETIESLRHMQTREEGILLLQKVCTTKASLLRLSKALDLPQNKTDSAERLQDRIVEGTIGYRLRSHAIQNHSVVSIPSGEVVA